MNVYHSPTGQETPKVINDMAEDENFDLIVVGSRGMGAIKAFLIGSVCNKICYDSPISVLIVK
ncbi:MAG: universal stress protein [Candidatus Bathyarchaeia archaeon]|nr:universal stress protein [Candidatus Bathyarchaeia archaeon]